MGWARRGTRSFEDKAFILSLAERKCWMGQDGRMVPISSMDSAHIRNCIRLLERKEAAGGDVLVAVFKRELELRGADLPPNAELEDRYRKLCAITRDLFTYYRKHRGPAYAQRYKEMLDDLGVDVR